MSLWWLIGAAAATVALWRVPYGAYVLFPFSALATWFHEMGHGLTAMLLGGRFETLKLFPDLSGQAFFSGRVFGGPFGRALVSAGGPMGPAVAGFFLILSSRRFETARWGLWALGLALWLSALLWVRTLFGLVFAALAGAAVLALARRGSRELQGFAVQFLGVQACISTFRQLDYLFMSSAVIGGSRMSSDSGNIAEALLLPYWFWGTLLSAATLGLLALGVYFAYRER